MKKMKNITFRSVAVVCMILFVSPLFSLAVHASETGEYLETDMQNVSDNSAEGLESSLDNDSTKYSEHSIDNDISENNEQPTDDNRLNAIELWLQETGGNIHDLEERVNNIEQYQLDSSTLLQRINQSIDLCVIGLNSILENMESLEERNMQTESTVLYRESVLENINAVSESLTKSVDKITDLESVTVSGNSIISDNIEHNREYALQADEVNSNRFYIYVTVGAMLFGIVCALIISSYLKR
ncbi:hypothetical protein EDD76_103164 [Kineothrix alysoides]|uniref:Uncharacterized protein n=1 Tax=Kineothrix alysoides TaxID=1469948 RepID=A0A4R1R3H5_9FIRM|nr:hypothetical protein [Kineothrix alysoides]TCL59973.1 hypothetical protein EDD76_103164 [Kineothrix alysoides]